MEVSTGERESVNEQMSSTGVLCYVLYLNSTYILSKWKRPAEYSIQIDLSIAGFEWSPINDDRMTVTNAHVARITAERRTNWTTSLYGRTKLVNIVLRTPTSQTVQPPIVREPPVPIKET